MIKRAGARTLRSKVSWNKEGVRDSIGSAFTMASLLMRMSIWKGWVGWSEVKWVFAVEMRCAGAESSRRLARKGSAVML